ncbi:MAG: glycosyltransferase family 39 protein [Desulfobacteraceae bacterium]|nr:glycosyltransferase family 39 protein [Desulfobacteraceae bacterium]
MGNLKLWFRGRPRWTFGAVLVIFLIALFLRLAVVWTLGAPPEKDAFEYHKIALSQLSGYGHALEPGKPTTLRPPLYPLFLAGIYAFTGSDYRHALYAQAILHALLVFPLFWLGFRISGSSLVGTLSASLFAIHTSFEIVSRLCRENITVILVVLFFWSVYEGFREPRVGKFVTAGLFSGLLGLTHAIFIPLSVALCFFGLLWSKSRNFVKLLVLQVLISIVIMTPWMIRNQLLPDKGQEAHIRSTLLYGYYPAFTEEWWWPVTDMVELEKKREEANYFFASQVHGRDLNSELRAKILSHPFEAVKLAISRILILWASPPVGSSLLKSYSPFLASIGLGLQYFFTLLGLATLAWKLPQRSELLVFAVLALFLTGVYAISHAIRRYGYPLVPQMCLFFAWGALDLWRRRKIRKDQ